MGRDEMPRDGHSAAPELFPAEYLRVPGQIRSVPYTGPERRVIRINGNPENLGLWSETELLNGLGYAHDRLGAARTDAVHLQAELDKRVAIRDTKPETPAGWFIRLAALQQGEPEPPDSPEPREP